MCMTRRMDRHKAAWIGVGLVLDAAVVVSAVLVMLPVLRFPPGSFFSGPLDVLMRNAVVGVCLLVVHGAMLPGLVWSRRPVSMKDVAYAGIIAVSGTAVLVFGTLLILFVGIGLLTGGAPSSSQAINTTLLGVVFVGGHLALGAVSLVLAMNMAGWAENRGWVRPGSEWLGGAAGGVLLAGAILAGVWTLKHGIRISWFCWLAGLPHLLLSARHLPPDMAPLPVALWRVTVLLVVLLATGLVARLV